MRLCSVVNQNSRLRQGFVEESSKDASLEVGSWKLEVGSWELGVGSGQLGVTIEGMDDCAPPAHTHAPVGNTSGRTVHCVKFQKNMPGLDVPPWPGELGQRVFENVSAQAWKLWEERQKMILNEYRLMPWQKEAQELISRQMEDFFFGESAALPPGYVPQQTK